MDLDSLAKHFPEARYHPAWRLVAWHPTGPLDNDQVDRIVEFLESQEKIEGEYFNRYTDMTGHTRIKIGLDHIVRIARRRREGYVGAPVKSAFYAVRAISLSIARMYEELMSGSQIQVCTFRSRAAAADWLGVPPEALEPQKGS
jgi:hypothetical protein